MFRRKQSPASHGKRGTEFLEAEQALLNPQFNWG